MAYNLKYQSDFYNIFSTKVSVQIFKKNYGAHDTIYLRTTDVTIEFNYQDRYTPVAGTGAKIGIINEGEFDSLNDLLTSREKEFLCVISYNNVVVFQGYSICDLNEQQFLAKAKITLQFTNYLRRLEGDYLECLSDIGVNTSLITVLKEVFTRIDLNYPLYINSTLFETNMLQTANDSYVEQTYIEDNMLFTSATEYDDTYTALNKILKPFGAFLYSHGNKWIIERQEDITRTGNWVLFSDIRDSDGVGASTASLKEEYNKQNGDWNYVDGSQVVTYDSGLHTLILDLKDKQLGTLVFNNYKVDMLSIATKIPPVGTLDLRTWYRYQDVVPLAVGYSFRGMNTFLKWSYAATDTSYWDEGLFYQFQVQFNLSEETPTILSVNYKMSGEMDLTPMKSVVVFFEIIVDGGPHSGEYLGYKTDGPVPGIPYLGLSATPIMTSQEFDVSVNPKQNKTWTMSQDFNLSDSILVDQPYGLPPAASPSIWEHLGKPTSQKFIIMFYPSKLNFKDNPLITNFYNKVNYIGDIEVTITQQEILNRLKYDINEDFIKTETQDMDFFDLENVNFSNGLMINEGSASDEFIKTKNWTSENSPESRSLMDVFAKNVFRNSFRTMHRIKASIMSDKYLKPFSVLTDDNLKIDSATDISLLLLGYTWDLNNGKYDILAEEYTDENIIFDEVASSAGGVVDDPNEVVTPTGLTVNQSAPGQHMTISWDESIGAQGYILQRRPSWYNVVWIPDWQTVYQGTALSFDDELTGGAIVSDTPIEYRVCAYIPNGSTPYSAIVACDWYN